MKKLYALLPALLLVFSATFGQANSANYVFSTNTSGSLTDMSAGTTQLVAGLNDDATSPVTTIGFDFWFMGVRYTQFSATSNGFVRLGATAASATQYALGSVNIPLIAALGSDLIVSSTGKVHYKVTGTAPNRVLVIEFRNMTIIYDGVGTSTDGTYQVRLSEGTNQIELAYGSMNRNTGTGFNNALNPQFIGFSTNSSNGTFATVDMANTEVSSGTPTANQFTLGAPMASLTSAADGSRRVYDFVPTATTDASGLNFTAVTASSETLNWTDNSADEVGFAVYRSDDGGATYNFIALTAASAMTYTATGLTQNTNYFWKVAAVREAPAAGVVASQTTTGAGTITSVSTGLWSNPATWSGNAVPTSGDRVTITAGTTVTEDIAGAAAYSLTVDGTLTYDVTGGKTLTTTFDLLIDPGGNVIAPSLGGFATNTLTIGGSLTNNGTLELSIGANGVGLIFTGATNNSFSGTGTTTDIRTLTINKTANSNVLELMPTVFSVQGVTADAATMNFLTLTSGTLKISGTFTFTGRTFATATFTIPAIAGFWLNNPNYTVAAQTASLTVTGLLHVSQGTLNVGTSSGNSVAFSVGSTIIVDGGTISTAGRFGVASAANSISYSQSAGTITVCTVGNASASLGSFDLGTNLNSVVSITGGTIICQLAATAIDYRSQGGGGLASITGGTLQLGNLLSGGPRTFNLRGVTPDLYVSSNGGNHTAIFTSTPLNYYNCTNNINVATGATLNLGNNLVFFNGPSFTNNGIVTDNGTASELIVSNQVSPVSYYGTGTLTGPINALALEGTQGFTIDAASAGLSALAVYDFYGDVHNANLLTIGGGAATTATLQFGNTTTPTPAGVFDAAPVYNPGTGGISLSYLRTTTARTTGPEIPATRTITTLTRDENDLTHPLTLAGGDLTVTGTYTQTNGDIITGSNTLVSGSSVAAPGTFTYTSGIIIGYFKRWITAAAASWTFPVGIAGNLRSSVIDFSANAPTAGGTLTASWQSSPEGTNGLPLNEPNANGGENLTQTSADGYWRVTAADGLTGGIYTATFTATGVSNADYTRLVLIKRPDPNQPWVLDGTYVPTSGSNAAPVLARTGMSGFSDFGIAADAGLVAVNLAYFRGIKQGAVNNLDWKINVSGSAVSVELQRSADGNRFDGIFSNIATSASALQPFAYTDNAPVAGKNYYRLKITELSGKISYSNIVVLISAGQATQLISIAPNPVSGGVCNVNVSAAKQVNLTLSITDMNGERVANQVLVAPAGYNTVSFDVSTLAAGTYIVSGSTDSGRTNTISMIKK